MYAFSERIKRNIAFVTRPNITIHLINYCVRKQLFVAATVSKINIFENVCYRDPHKPRKIPQIAVYIYTSCYHRRHQS